MTDTGTIWREAERKVVLEFIRSEAQRLGRVGTNDQVEALKKLELDIETGVHWQQHNSALLKGATVFVPDQMGGSCGVCGTALSTAGTCPFHPR